MDYRGHDLDLRTSRWSATSTDPSGWREVTSGTHPAPAHTAAPRTAPRSAPIWVDETVLSCANQAYDIALAYRSAEVRLEHLLLAMTRVEPAAAALEKHGVRVPALRRDCAVSIAAELPSIDTEGGTPARSPELEDVLRVAASRASSHGEPASVDDVIQALSEIGGDLPGGELVTRHVPRHSREYWGTVTGHRTVQRIAAPEAGEGEKQALVAAPPPAPAIDPTLIQRLFDRLTEVEHAFTTRVSDVGLSFSDRVSHVERSFAERLTALETALSHRPNIAPVDISPLDNRLVAIEAALLNQPSGGGVVAIDPAITDRLWAIEHALGTERTERASAITQLSDEISAVRSAVRLAAQSSEQAQAQLGEEVQKIATEVQSVVLQLQQFGDNSDQSRIDLSSSIGDRIATIEKALDAYEQKTTEAHAVYSGELSEVHDALMKISANQNTLAGALDSWRNNDSGEIHLINARIGAVHEDGAKRLSALEKLCADVETLSQLVLEDRSQQPPPRSSFKQWLYGTEDWLRASWQRVGRAAPAEPKPRPSSRGFWPFRRRSSAL